MVDGEAPALAADRTPAVGRQEQEKSAKLRASSIRASHSGGSIPGRMMLESPVSARNQFSKAAALETR
jgi:hypothetical protein